mmetsp:Transcript_19883/g.48242  ORF Transcript_19883/g.48242 Transcript_19883/m.48242 type:complete len:242 (-) Transcript_19883:384-1109(-)
MIRMAMNGLHKPIVAIDMDEVLCQFLKGMIAFHNKHYHTSYQVADFHSYLFYEVWGGSYADTLKKVHDFFETDYFRNLEIVPGAVEGIHRLRDRFRLVVVTSRQTSIQEESMRWLDRHFPGVFEDVLFGNHFSINGHEEKRTKREMCEEVNAIALVDDAPSYIEDARHCLQKAILFDLDKSYGWNQKADLSHPNTVRCTDWEGVVRELEALVADPTPSFAAKSAPVAAGATGEAVKTSAGG